MEQLLLFQPQMPSYERLAYLARLLKIKRRPGTSKKLMEVLFETLEPKIEEFLQAEESGVFEPYIEPELLLFYADYEGLATK